MKLNDIDILKPYTTSILNSWKYVFAKGFSGLGRSSRSEYWGFQVLSTLILSIIVISVDLTLWGFIPQELLVFVPIVLFWMLAVDNFSILIVLGVSLPPTILDELSPASTYILFVWLLTIAHLFLKLPLMVRRLGDLGLSWLYIFFSIVPLFHYGLTILMFFKGMDEDNEFGPGYT